VPADSIKVRSLKEAQLYVPFKINSHTVKLPDSHAKGMIILKMLGNDE
jgi:hypothetical protein